VVTNTPPHHFGTSPPTSAHTHTHTQFFIESNVSVQPSDARNTGAICKEGYPAMRSNQMFQIYKKVFSDWINLYDLPCRVSLLTHNFMGQRFSLDREISIILGTETFIILFTRTSQKSLFIFALPI